MKSFFKSFLLAVLLSTTAVSATNVTGRWSGTLEPEGQTDSKPVYMILQQDGKKLSGSVGPNESEQHPLENGKVEGDKLTLTSHWVRKRCTLRWKLKGTRSLAEGNAK